MRWLAENVSPMPRWGFFLYVLAAGIVSNAINDYFDRNNVPAAYRAGYAAAVDSVRACDNKTDIIRILDAYGASYTVQTFNAAGRETSMVHVGGLR